MQTHGRDRVLSIATNDGQTRELLGYEGNATTSKAWRHKGIHKKKVLLQLTQMTANLHQL